MLHYEKIILILSVQRGLDLVWKRGAGNAWIDSVGTRRVLLVATGVACAMSYGMTRAADLPAAPGTGDLAEVVVTGQRAAIRRAEDIKENSISVVDAVSAEELQRVDVGVGAEYELSATLKLKTQLGGSRLCRVAERSPIVAKPASGVVSVGIAYVF
jgi:hypothetical protein